MKRKILLLLTALPLLLTSCMMSASGEELYALPKLPEEYESLSARLSETQFLITPSGLAYETLRPEQLVLVNVADASWEGEIKPSSEKGIHAGAYRLRPEVNFVIHTHQYYASVAGIEGRALTGFCHPLLGKRVPCAAYGLPGTGRLRQAVEAEETAWPGSRPVRSHSRISYRRRHRGRKSAVTARSSAMVTHRAPLSPSSSKPRPSAQPG